MLRDDVVGILCMVLGFILFFLALSNFLFRILFALLGLVLINYGLKVRGRNPIVFHIIRLRDSFWYS